MDDGIGQDIVMEITEVCKVIAKQNELQEQSNVLAGFMVEALQSIAQELQDLRKHLEQSKS